MEVHLVQQPNIIFLGSVNVNIRLIAFHTISNVSEGDTDGSVEFLDKLGAGAVYVLIVNALGRDLMMIIRTVSKITANV